MGYGMVITTWLTVVPQVQAKCLQLLLEERCVPQLPGAREDGVFNLCFCFQRDCRVYPLTVTCKYLTEHRNAHAVGPELPTKNVNIQLEALIW